MHACVCERRNKASVCARCEFQKLTSSLLLTDCSGAAFLPPLTGRGAKPSKRSTGQ
jgi:hypothetical protein